MIICELCKQQPATLHLTEIADNVKKEVHLCGKCAQQKGVSIQGGFSLPDFLGASASAAPQQPSPKGKKGGSAGIACPVCGMRYSDFRQIGRLGCPEDYRVFRRGLNPFIERVHGSLQHCGKVPRRSSEAGGEQMERSRELIRLRHDLKSAVDGEEYERAAQIRDKIRRLEKEETAHERE